MSLQQDTVAPMNLQTVKAFMQQENHLTQVSDAECKRLDAKLRAAQDYLGQCLILAEPVLRIQEAAQTTFQDFKQALIEFVATQPSHSDENQITRLAQEFCRAPVVAQHINAWFGTRWRYSEPVSTTDENLINAIETLITKLNDELPSTFFPRTARLKQEKIMALHCLLEYAVMTEEPISACIPFILQDFPGAVTGIFSRVELLLEAASDHAINNRNCIKNN